MLLPFFIAPLKSICVKYSQCSVDGRTNPTSTALSLRALITITRLLEPLNGREAEAEEEEEGTLAFMEKEPCSDRYMYTIEGKQNIADIFFDAVFLLYIVPVHCTVHYTYYTFRFSALTLHTPSKAQKQWVFWQSLGLSFSPLSPI